METLQELNFKTAAMRNMAMTFRRIFNKEQQVSFLDNSYSLDNGIFTGNFCEKYHTKGKIAIHLLVIIKNMRFFHWLLLIFYSLVSLRKTRKIK